MRQTIILLIVFCFSLGANSQEATKIHLKLTLDEVIDIAKKQSLNAFKAKNMYLADYWAYRSFKAQMLPALSLNTTPYFYSEGINTISTKEGDYQQFSRKNYSAGQLNFAQPVKLTGGEISVNSAMRYKFERIRDKDTVKLNEGYLANPVVSINYRQDITSTMYNELKWVTKLKPLEFEKAKLDYITNAEQISNISVNYFFSLAQAQVELNIATTNYSNADTLYRIAKGRFEIGTITQDELLDLELGLLNAKTNLTRKTLALQRAQKRLNTFLMLDQSILVECIIPQNIPELEISFDKALSNSIINNPLAKRIKINNLTAQQNVARTKSKKGFSGTVNFNYGLTNTGASLDDAYIEPDNAQDFNIQLTVPILDWGVRKGAYLQAKSNKEVTRLQNEQDWIAFEQDLFMNVMSFNIQDEQVYIAAKADTVSQMGYKVTKQRFFIDKVDVIRLNEARKSLEEAKGQYIDALKTYWNYYYTIRQQTLYDFEKNTPLIVDFDRLLKESTL